MTAEVKTWLGILDDGLSEAETAKAEPIELSNPVDR